MKKLLDKKSGQGVNAQLDQTWQELEQKFKSIGVISPTTGSALRWQQKLVLFERRQLCTRRLWVLAANSMVVLLFLAVCAAGGWSLLQQAEASAVLAKGLMAFRVFSIVIADAGLSILREVSLAAWVFFSAICASWALSKGEAWQ